MSTRIKKVGIELEGGWGDKNMGPGSLFEDPISISGKDLEDKIHQDISVGNVGADPNFRMTSPHVGEIASPPLLLKDALEWMEEHYPIETNHSCGLHIHVSFKTILDYSLLMEEEFWTFFMKEANIWGEKMKFPKDHQFWPRLRGENRFCFAQFRPEEQISLTTKPQDGARRDIRRTHLNYCYGFPNEDGSPRGTLECRLFPMFKKVVTAQKALLWLIDTYETFLKEAPKEERKTIRLTKNDLRKPLPKKTQPTFTQPLGREVPIPPIPQPLAAPEEPLHWRTIRDDMWVPPPLPFRR